MAVLVRYALNGMTTQQYESTGRKLDEAGHWPPPGLPAASPSERKATCT